jgi:hypothetical protein
VLRCVVLIFVRLNQRHSRDEPSLQGNFVRLYLLLRFSGHLSSSVVFVQGWHRSVQKLPRLVTVWEHENAAYQNMLAEEKRLILEQRREARRVFCDRLTELWLGLLCFVLPGERSMLIGRFVALSCLQAACNWPWASPGWFTLL